MRLKAVNGSVIGVYREPDVALLRNLGYKLEFSLFSHVDPVDDGTGFKIVWLHPEAIKAIGQKETLMNDQGDPFPTREAALAAEQSLLASRLFAA